MKAFLVCSFILYVAANYEAAPKEYHENDVDQNIYGAPQELNYLGQQNNNVESPIYGEQKPNYDSNIINPYDSNNYELNKNCEPPTYFTIRGNRTRKAKLDIHRSRKEFDAAVAACPNNDRLYALVAKQYKHDDDLTELRNIVTLAYGSNIATPLVCFKGKYYTLTAVIDDLVEVKRLACIELSKESFELMTQLSSF